jgi:hypothetical protein
MTVITNENKLHRLTIPAVGEARLKLRIGATESDVNTITSHVKILIESLGEVTETLRGIPECINGDMLVLLYNNRREPKIFYSSIFGITRL